MSDHLRYANNYVGDEPEERYVGEFNPDLDSEQHHYQDYNGSHDFSHTGGGADSNLQVTYALADWPEAAGEGSSSSYYPQVPQITVDDLATAYEDRSPWPQDGHNEFQYSEGDSYFHYATPSAEQGQTLGFNPSLLAARRPSLGASPTAWSVNFEPTTSHNPADEGPFHGTSTEHSLEEYNTQFSEITSVTGVSSISVPAFHAGLATPGILEIQDAGLLPANHDTGYDSNYCHDPSQSRTCQHPGCPKAFKTTKDLARHARTHGKPPADRDYICRCGYAPGGRKDNFNRHLKTCNKDAFKFTHYQCHCGLREEEEARSSPVNAVIWEVCQEKLLFPTLLILASFEVCRNVKG
ncbi:hypothetical protein BX600DRAFT_316916 [Xylariales sp. PMI_506]|nr:hypothetical protein BX600DRAFT_316916 [Xylariales sp. PMI_506]